MTTALSPGYRVARWGYLAFCVAAFVFLIVFALLALTTVEWLRRRGGTAGQRVG